jgi:hypothetical protein
MLEGFCFAAFFSRAHTLHVSICVFSVLFSFAIFDVSLRVCLSACSFFVVCLFRDALLFCAGLFLLLFSQKPLLSFNELPDTSSQKVELYT